MADAKSTLYGLEDLKEETSSKKEGENDYKVITISLYNDDIELLDNYVAQLKKEGHRRINKSKVLRYALRSLDISKIPKE